MTLTGSGGNATVDTAGYTVTLSGSPRARRTDQDRQRHLILAGANTYTGGTTVSGGTPAPRNRAA